MIEQLHSILEKSKFSYELIQHEKPILSALDGADYFGIEIGQTAPTLIIKTEKGFFSLIVSGNRGKVNFDDIENFWVVAKLNWRRGKRLSR